MHLRGSERAAETGTCTFDPLSTGLPRDRAVAGAQGPRDQFTAGTVWIGCGLVAHAIGRNAKAPLPDRAKYFGRFF